MNKTKPIKPAAKKPVKTVAKKYVKVIKKPTKGAITRKKVAAAVVRGKTERQIADELGISQPAVNKAKQHPEYLTDVLSIMQRQNPRLEKLLGLHLEHIESVFKNKQSTPAQKYQAAEKVIDLLKMQIPKEKSGDTNVHIGFTMEQVNAAAAAERLKREQQPTKS